MSNRPVRMSEREFVAAMAFLTAMAALAIDMLLPAFTDMRASLGLEPDSTELSLVVSLFFLGIALGTPFFGPISDSIGRKPTVYMALAIYAAGAAITMLAPSLAWVYVGRIVWGIGAAGPSTLSVAILSDRFAGDQLSRMTALVRAIFYLGPVVAPIAGGGIISFASWRVVVAVSLLTASVVGLWLTRMNETLDPGNRKPLTLRATARGFRLVFHSRQSIGMAFTIMFGFGSFLSFLGSSELVLSDVFGRGDQFVLYFSASGVIYGLTAYMISRAVRRFASATVLRASALVHLAASMALLAIGISTDGRPQFWVWIPVFTLANAAFLAMEPVAYSLALAPMGEQAGTASAVVQLLSASVGALLAWFIDRSIDGSVTPQGVGYAIYATLALVAVWWGLARARSTGDTHLKMS